MKLHDVRHPLHTSWKVLETVAQLASRDAVNLHTQQ